MTLKNNYNLEVIKSTRACENCGAVYIPVGENYKCPVCKAVSSADPGNFIPNLIAEMRENKNKYGRFYFSPKCATGFTLTIEDLKNGGSYEQFIKATVEKFFDYYTDNNFKSPVEGLTKYAQRVDFEDLKYVRSNLADIILRIYTTFSKDGDLRRGNSFEATIHMSKEILRKKIKKLFSAINP